MSPLQKSVQIQTGAEDAGGDKVSCIKTDTYQVWAYRFGGYTSGEIQASDFAGSKEA